MQVYSRRRGKESKLRVAVCSGPSLIILPTPLQTHESCDTHTHTHNLIYTKCTKCRKSWVSLECQPVTLRIKVSTKGKVLQSPKLFRQFFKNLNLVTTFVQESATMYLLRPSPRNINARDKSYSVSLSTTQFSWTTSAILTPVAMMMSLLWYVFPTAGSASAVLTLYWSIATQTELIINISRADNNWTDDSSRINEIISISLVIYVCILHDWDTIWFFIKNQIAKISVARTKSCNGDTHSIQRWKRYQLCYHS